MSVPCSDQDARPKKAKIVNLPPGVRAERCWCGHPAKVKEVEDFSDQLGMKFFMCANYNASPPRRASSSSSRPPSPPPLCRWYHWIDTEQPAWALQDIEDRSRRAWDSFHARDRAERNAARAKEERERAIEELREEQMRWLHDWGKDIKERKIRMKEEERVRKETREAERQRYRERAAEAEVAEKRGDKTGK